MITITQRALSINIGNCTDLFILNQPMDKTSYNITLIISSYLFKEYITNPDYPARK